MAAVATEDPAGLAHRPERIQQVFDDRTHDDHIEVTRWERPLVGVDVALADLDADSPDVDDLGLGGAPGIDPPQAQIGSATEQSLRESERGTTHFEHVCTW